VRRAASSLPLEDHPVNKWLKDNQHLATWLAVPVLFWFAVSWVWLYRENARLWKLVVSRSSEAFHRGIVVGNQKAQEARK
jgi:hypothetical protein